jgi:O-antigen ligase
VAFYLGSLFLTIYYTVINKKWVEGISFALGMLIIPVLSYYMLPTFKQKIDYVCYDVSKYFTYGDAADLSDGQRLFSLKMGWEVFMHNKLCGVGVGDLIDEMNSQYEHHQNIETSKRLPHNQWLWTAVSGGLVGIGMLAVALFLPLWLLRKKLNWFFVVFFIVLHSSMLSEATLESQIGVALYIIFYLLSVSMILREHES